MAKSEYRDIEAIKEDFFSNNLSYKQLADKYQCSYSWISGIGAEQKWMQERKRRNQEIAKKAREVTKERMQNYLVKTKDRHFDAFQKVLILVEKALENPKKHLTYSNGAINLANVERAANVLRNVQDGQLLALGLDNDTRRTDLAFEKLEIEKKKLFGLDDEELPDDGFEEAADLGTDVSDFMKESLEKGDIDLG